MKDRDAAELSLLTTPLEPGKDAWSDFRVAEAYYQLPPEGDTKTRFARLRQALMRELEEINPEEAAKVRRATSDALAGAVAKLAPPTGRH
jgi:hypothetical protein